MVQCRHIPLPASLHDADAATEAHAASSSSSSPQSVFCSRFLHDAANARAVSAAIETSENTDGNPEQQYFTFDANFNVTALISSGASVLERYEYDPYGNVTVLNPDFSDHASADGAYEQYILFAGYRHDVESGLYEVRNRMYHPTLGRWLQRDPIGYVDGGSLYEYVRSGATRHTDPTGRHIRYLPPIVRCLIHAFVNPMNDNDPACDEYGDRTYRGVKLKCFCKCAGNSPWSIFVRACLRCLDELGIPTDTAHDIFYAVADAHNFPGGRPWTTPGWCLIKCNRNLPRSPVDIIPLIPIPSGPIDVPLFQLMYHCSGDST